MFGILVVLIETLANFARCDPHDGVGVRIVIGLAFKDRVVLYFDHHVKVAGRATIQAGLSFIRQSQARPGVHARWNIHLQLSLVFDVAFAAALRAGAADDLAAPGALVAGTADLQEALLINHFSTAMAHGAGDDAIVLFRASSLAARA